MKPILKSAGALALACVSQFVLHGVAAEPTFQEKSVSPVTNPLFFEDPYIRTEIRPIFAYHRIGDDLLNGVGLNGISSGDVRVYALQLRYAVTDRLAIIATKDGYTTSTSTTPPSPVSRARVGTTSPPASNTPSSRTSRRSSSSLAA